MQMNLAGFNDSALGRVWVPEYFAAEQIGALPGFVCERSGAGLFLDTLDGWVHQYEEIDTPDHLSGFFSKITRGLKKVFRKIRSIPKKIWKETRRAASKINAQRKKLVKSVLKNKWTRQLVRVAGAAFAPFTGGLSLAAAEAAARYGKARYVQGMKRSSAFKRGAVGAVIGYAGGRAIGAGYSAFQKGGVSALNPFSGAAKATTAATKVGGAVVTPAGTTVATGTTASGGLWGNIGSGALKVAGKLAPTVIQTVMQAKQAQAGAGGVQYVDDYGYASDPGYVDYGSYVDPNAMESVAYGSGYGGGGSTVVPDGMYSDEGDMLEEEMLAQESAQKFMPVAILAAGAIASVVILKSGKPRRRK